MNSMEDETTDDDDGSSISLGLRLDSVCSIPASFAAPQRTFSADTTITGNNHRVRPANRLRPWLLLWLQVVVVFCVAVVLPVVLITVKRGGPLDEQHPSSSTAASSAEYPDPTSTSASTGLVNSSFPLSRSSTEVIYGTALPKLLSPNTLFPHSFSLIVSILFHPR